MILKMRFTNVIRIQIYSYATKSYFHHSYFCVHG